MKEATKTKNRTGTKTTTKIQQKFVVILIGAFILIGAPLVHIILPKKNTKVTAYKKELKASEAPLKKQLADLAETYRNSDSPASEYFTIMEPLQSKLEALQAANEKALDLKVDSERYWGWKTKRTFWIGFGVRLPLLIMAIIISMLIANRQSDQRYRSKALFWLQVSCYGVALYQVIWCFWYAQDYPLSTYWYALLLFTLSVGVFVTYQFRYYTSVMGQLHRLKADFMDFLVEVRNVHYKPMVKKVLRLKKAVSFAGIRDEVEEEEFNNEIKELENRLHEKAKELID